MYQRIETTLKSNLSCQASFRGQLSQSLSNSLLPFIESPYYYCHYKGLDLSIAKSEIPLFPPPTENLYGFFHCLTDSLRLWWLIILLKLGNGLWIRKRGIYFPLHTSCLRCKDGISPPQAPRSPFLFLHSYSQHLWETRMKKTWNFVVMVFGCGSLEPRET